MAHFETKLARHVEAHPDFVNQLQELAHYRRTLQDNVEGEMRQLLGELAALEAALPRPDFSCPTCRSGVASRPNQEIALRHASELLGTYLGDQGPDEEHGVQRGNNVWAHFFGVP